LIRVGTSGFSYDEWKGSFYPENLPSSKYLSFYAEHLKTTEINNTFYRIPSQKMTARWVDQVPHDFRFTLKLSQRITHKKRLRDVDEEMSWFINGIEPLGELLGCILVQLPPWHRQELDTIGAFLENYASRFKLAFEFRHESWFQPATYQLLQEKGAALVVAETSEDPGHRERTAEFNYLRLRKGSYSDEELQEWATWVRESGKETFVYFKHERDAPELARRFMTLCAL